MYIIYIYNNIYINIIINIYINIYKKYIDIVNYQKNY